MQKPFTKQTKSDESWMRKVGSETLFVSWHVFNHFKLSLSSLVCTSIHCDVKIDTKIEEMRNWDGKSEYSRKLYASVPPRMGWMTLWLGDEAVNFYYKFYYEIRFAPEKWRELCVTYTHYVVCVLLPILSQLFSFWAGSLQRMFNDDGEKKNWYWKPYDIFHLARGEKTSQENETVYRTKIYCSELNKTELLKYTNTPHISWSAREWKKKYQQKKETNCFETCISNEQRITCSHQI